MLKSLIDSEFWRDESGATAIEYGLIAGAMTVVLVPAFAATVDGVGTLFTRIADLFHSPIVFN